MSRYEDVTAHFLNPYLRHAKTLVKYQGGGMIL